MKNTKIRAPKVSVLIPVFNRKEYIAECIQSALDQSFTDFEVVVVDNASDDGTWEICQQFAKLDQRVRIFRNALNIGPVRNWIRCAEEANGEFCKILFSDDTLETNCLIEMVPKLDDQRVAFVTCAAYIGKSKDESIIAYKHSDSLHLSSKNFISLLLSGNASMSPGSALIRTRDLLKNLQPTFATSTSRKFEAHGSGPDVMILLLTAKNYSFVANISTPLVYFRVHSDSFSIKNKNNEVTKGYQSAIALFLFENSNRSTWLYCLSNYWIQQMRFDKRWRSPFAHLKEFEGKGDLSEVIILCLFALSKTIKFSFHFLTNKIKKN